MMIMDYPVGEGLTTTVPKVKQAYTTLPQYIFLKKNFIFPASGAVARQVKVLQPFHIKVEQLEKECVASSDISDIFEVGDTFKEAVLHYLRSLADELLWLQEHKDGLSSDMLEELKKIQCYLASV